MKTRLAAKSASIQRFNTTTDIGSICIDLDMTESQMYLALLNFLDHITDETWTKWKEQIDAEVYGQTEEA